MAKEQPAKPTFLQSMKQLPQIVKFVAGRDKWFIPLALAAVLVPLAAGGVAVALGFQWLWLVTAVMAAVVGFMFVLSVRANKARFNQLEGEVGAAAQLLSEMRGDWRVHPAFTSTTDYDMVHVVIGRPGVILVGEVGDGTPQKVRGLIGQAKKRLAKIIGSVDLHEFIVGDDEDQVALKKIKITLMKLPRTVTGKDVNALDTRIKALAARPQMPKGSVPKNMRPPRGAYRAMRGR
jgi:hypothetical protein